MVRRLELEKDELQQALDEAEAALEAEESKVLRAQVEVSQIRSEIEKRIQEKEEEFENTRKNHQRAIDSMQASLESETKGRAELLRVKKKLESDINELELGSGPREQGETQTRRTTSRSTVEQIRELQMTVEEEQRTRDGAAGECTTRRRSAAPCCRWRRRSSCTSLDSCERATQGRGVRRPREPRDAANSLSVENGSLVQAQAEAGDGAAGSARGSGRDAQRAARLRRSDPRSADGRRGSSRRGAAQPSRSTPCTSSACARVWRAPARTCRSVSTRPRPPRFKGGKKAIAKLEGRLREVETELDGEQRRHQDTVKNLAKADRRTRELAFQIDEDKKNQDRLQDLCDKLQQKIKTCKRQVEEAEELANVNLAKYRTAHPSARGRRRARRLRREQPQQDALQVPRRHSRSWRTHELLLLRAIPLPRTRHRLRHRHQLPLTTTNPTRPTHPPPPLSPSLSHTFPPYLTHLMRLCRPLQHLRIVCQVDFPLPESLSY